MTTITMEEALTRAGAGAYQRRLMGIFGLVWAADAMQVLAIGFTAASIATTFHLQEGIAGALQTGTTFFLGMLIGALGFGKLADRFGRRRILLITVACDAVFGTLSIFAPSFELLLILRFLTGAAVGGTLPVDYAMMAEFLPARHRGRWLVLLEGFWAIGTLIVALAAWLINLSGFPDAWRYIFAVTAVPAIIGIGLRLMVPESPLYLVRIDRQTEAKRIIDQMLKKNRRLPLTPGAQIVSPPIEASKGIFSAGLRRRSILILSIWLLVSISYYGVFTWMPAKLAAPVEAGGQGFGFVRGYGFLVMIALAQLPGYALAAYGVERWGRKLTLILFCLLSASGCLLFVLAPSANLVACALLVMSFALLGTWGALYAYTPELFPTKSRATAMGAAGAMARFGGLLAPTAVGSLVSHGLTLTIASFAGLLLLAAFASVFIDQETRQTSLS
ncbi:MFS transporter [Oryzifoliimicrobium ureilyticus]|uniref:MFS transporter n=1 Tax=Oryzifoliimicrobium ureilyticus TaxID=3113724 RepID=UPI0030761A94